MISTGAKNMAMDILLSLSSLNYLPDKIMESAEGGIGFVWLRNGKQADIEVFNSCSAYGGIYPKDSETEVFPVYPSLIEEAVDRIKAFMESS